MGSWEEALHELRGEFVRNASARLERMRLLAAALRADPEDGGARHQLVLQFHGLAGAGTTYGFPEVTRLGLLGEQLARRGDGQDGSVANAAPGVESVIEDLGRALHGPGGAVAETPPQEEDRPQPAAPGRARVLLVEDDPDWSRMFKQRLEAEGYQVAEAGCRAEAEAALRDGLPGAIVCDVLLPDGNGYALVAAVRQLPEGDELPILMVSMRAGFLDKVEAIASGADGFFEKPLDWDALFLRLQQLVERQRLEPARVLCVEDFEEQATYLSRVLGSAGYEVQTLADPSGFEAAMAAFQPDIVLMDVLLPGMSGYDVARYLRQQPRFVALPVLFLTTQARPEDRLRALKAGGDDYLVKPVAPALLLTAVAAHLERARLLRSLVEHDGLTRLMTHSAFVQRAKDAYQRAKRRPELRAALLMVDLDSFKAVNDRYGHPEGDRVLVACAALLRRRLRQSDVVGRYGGEEFAVLLEGLEEADAMRLANRLCEDFAALQHRAGDGSTFGVTLSAGVACLDAAAMSFEAWRKEADDALYAAKAQGRNRVVAASQRQPKREA